MDNRVNATVGKRIQEARTRKVQLTQQALCDRLSNCMNTPKKGVEREILNLSRFKQWERGAAPVATEWLPAICEVCQCDVGYLFGEYSGWTREKTNVHIETGLSIKAIEAIQAMPETAKVTLNRILESPDNVLEMIDEYLRFSLPYDIFIDELTGNVSSDVAISVLCNHVSGYTISKERLADIYLFEINNRLKAMKEGK